MSQESRIQKSVAALGRLLSQHAVQVGVLAAVVLALYGRVTGIDLPLALALLIGGRSAMLAAEALRRPWSESDWQQLREQLRLEAERAGATAGAAGEKWEEEEEELGPPMAPREVADAVVEARRRAYVSPRPRIALLSEWIGLVSFVGLLPLAYVLFTSDIVSLRRGYGYVASATALLCLAAYAWPHRWRPEPETRDRRNLWWRFPSVPALALVWVGVTQHHPYLDPTREDRSRLAAERVLELQNNVVAGGHADWVFAWAAEVAARGEVEEAIALYRRGLHLAPRAEWARRRLEALEHSLEPPVADTRSPVGADPRPHARGHLPAAFARLPLWSEGESPPPLEACNVGPELERVEGTTVVVIALGELAPGTLEAIGDVLRRELGVGVCAAPSRPLPEADRVLGLVFGRQWNTRSLLEGFWKDSRPLPTAPVAYLLVTARDIYSDDTSFVFSSSQPFAAVMSYARLGDDGDPETRLHRTAKQALGATIKTFGLPPAADPHCVTSYTNGLEQFDLKGNRPTLETWLAFRAKVDVLDARWRTHLARQPTTREPRPSP